MIVAIAGARGKIARRLTRRLAARGDAVPDEPRAVSRVLYLIEGEDSVEQALAKVLA